jgi:hypothetical protein
MPTAADLAEAPTAIQTNLAAIFVSLELSRSVWLITSLSPGSGEKMSKHSVPAGDIAALLARFAELNQKALARTGQSFPIVCIQETGLDGFWLHRVLESEGIESHVVDPASIATSRRRRRAKTDRIDGESLLRALLAYKRGEPRVCAMVRAPTPEEEDRRRLSRERKVLVAERVEHVTRIKGLLFSQGVSGYEPLRRDRRKRLDELMTGDGRSLPTHIKTQISREPGTWSQSCHDGAAAKLVDCCGPLFRLSFHWNDLAARLEPVQIVCPPFRHFDALFPEHAARVGPANRVGVLMRQSAFDGIGGKLSAFVQQGRSRRAEAVRRQLVMRIAQPPQRRVQGVFGNRIFGRTKAGKNQAPRPGERAQLGQDGERLPRQRNLMLSPHLRPACWYRPNRLRQIKFRPFRHPQFAGAREDQRQEPQRGEGFRLSIEAVHRPQESPKLRRIDNRGPMLRYAA